MELKRVHQDFSVCQVKDYSFVNFESQYCFIGKTDEGILSKIAVLLADNEISIFAVSTYNTDYVLIKRENYQRGLEILEVAGYKIVD